MEYNKCLNCNINFPPKLMYKKRFCCNLCASKYWNKTHKKEGKIAREKFFNRNPLIKEKYKCKYKGKYNQYDYQKDYYQVNKNNILHNKKEWRKNNKDKYKEQRKRWRDKNKDNILEKIKESSRRKANYKINIKGVLCFDCKIKQAEERHHEDYNNPYEVLLLCGNCHKIRHIHNQDKGGFKK